MATLKVNFISPSPGTQQHGWRENIRLGKRSTLTGGKFLKLASVTVQFGTGGQSVKASINGVSWKLHRKCESREWPIHIPQLPPYHTYRRAFPLPSQTR